MGHKSGALTDKEYISRYHKILESLQEEDWLWLRKQGFETGAVVLGCYCPSGVFCHTKVLARYASEKFPELFENETELD